MNVSLSLLDPVITRTTVFPSRLPRLSSSRAALSAKGFIPFWRRQGVLCLVDDQRSVRQFLPQLLSAAPMVIPPRLFKPSPMSIVVPAAPTLEIPIARSARLATGRACRVRQCFRYEFGRVAGLVRPGST